MKANKKTKKLITAKPEPFVKWAGGKNQLINQLTKFFPKEGEYKNYIEPFLGGGAVFFHLQPESAILSDLNEDLINCYKVIKNNVNAVITILQKYQSKHREKFYYELRKQYNSGELDINKKVAAFIYLNKASYNGVHRVNSKGSFNVPYGKKVNANVFSKPNLIAVSKILKNVKLQSMSYEKILNFAKKGDFVYLDPPYYPLNKTSNFTQYTKNSFLEREHRQLANIYRILDKRGCKIMLSNSNTNLIRNLYEKYHIYEVEAKRFINCIGGKRGNITELVIINYDPIKL